MNRLTAGAVIGVTKGPEASKTPLADAEAVRWGTKYVVEQRAHGMPTFRLEKGTPRLDAAKAEWGIS